MLVVKQKYIVSKMWSGRLIVSCPHFTNSLFGVLCCPQIINLQFLKIHIHIMRAVCGCFFYTIIKHFCGDSSNSIITI